MSFRRVASKPVGPVPLSGAAGARRLRRLDRVWTDRDGNISYLLTLCVDGRIRVLDNEQTFQRLISFLLESPQRYDWFSHRFVVMPDHIHLIAHQGFNAVRLGQWIKAMKAVVGGLERRAEGPVGVPGLQDAASVTDVGRVPSPGALSGGSSRAKRTWRWQDGFHDHKLHTPESESRKWEYVCLNPVRYGLVTRPEEWAYAGEIIYNETGGPQLFRGTPPILKGRVLIHESDSPDGR